MTTLPWDLQPSIFKMVTFAVSFHLVLLKLKVKLLM